MIEVYTNTSFFINKGNCKIKYLQLHLIKQNLYDKCSDILFVMCLHSDLIKQNVSEHKQLIPRNFWEFSIIFIQNLVNVFLIVLQITL